MSVSGRTVTYTRANGGTGTITTQDNNTWNANSKDVAGYVSAPTSSNANKVWKTDGSGNPGWRDDTNTWRGIQNNLTSTSTADSLSAYQGKLLNDNKVSNTITSQGGTVSNYGKAGNIWCLALGKMVICTFYVQVSNATGTWTDYQIGTLPSGYLSTSNSYGTATDQNTGKSCVISVGATNTNRLYYNAKGSAISGDTWLYGQVIYVR